MKLCTVDGCYRPHRCKGFCGMHYQRVVVGKDAGNYAPKKASNGEGWIQGGYRMHSVKDGRELEHVMVVEKTLGYSLPDGAIVHHIDGNRKNNKNSNLVVCPSIAYHMLIHARQRAYDECGHADWLKCTHCKQYDKPENLYIRPTRRNAHHRACHATYKRTKRTGGNYAKM